MIRKSILAILPLGLLLSGCSGGSNPTPVEQPPGAVVKQNTATKGKGASGAMSAAGLKPGGSNPLGTKAGP